MRAGEEVEVQAVMWLCRQVRWRSQGVTSDTILTRQWQRAFDLWLPRNFRRCLKRHYLSCVSSQASSGHMVRNSAFAQKF